MHARTIDHSIVVHLAQRSVHNHQCVSVIRTTSHQNSVSCSRESLSPDVTQDSEIETNYVSNSNPGRVNLARVSLLPAMTAVRLHLSEHLHKLKTHKTDDDAGLGDVPMPMLENRNKNVFSDFIINDRSKYVIDIQVNTAQHPFPHFIY